MPKDWDQVMAQLHTYSVAKQLSVAKNSLLDERAAWIHYTVDLLDVFLLG